MQRVRFSLRSLPVALALTTIIAYGLLLPLTGFYWDDWPFAWIAHFLGPAEFFPAFQGFRPFLAPIFYFTTSLLPGNPLLWQIASLVMRFLAAWTAWWSIHQVWPTSPKLTVAAAFLFLVFPGYSQHWVALTHINQEWFSLIAYLASIGISARALRHPAAALRLTLLALILQLVGLLPTEYFATLEPLRGLLFLAVLTGPVGRMEPRWRSLSRAWWPYLVVWILNGIWLLSFYRSGAYISYDLAAAATPPAPPDVIWTFADALFKAAAYVWIQVIPLTAAAITSPTSLATWGVILVSFLLLVIYLPRLSSASPKGASVDAAGPTLLQDEDARRHTDGAQALAIGIVGILLGRIPSFAAGLPLTLQSSFDRLTISMMLGAALLLGGTLQLLVSKHSARMYLLAALAALAIGQQFFNANIFRRDWQRQQSIYWQLAWRMPDIQPDTAILTQQMPLDYETDLAMTAAVNWMYASQVRPPRLPLAVVYTEKRLGGVVLPALEPGLPMRMPLRTMTFLGNTSQVIAIYVPASGCLRVFDPALDDTTTYSRLPEAATAAIPLSDPQRIIVNASPRQLPSPPFSAEPQHEWCYFYEKAELARQTLHWSEIIQLRQQVVANGLEPVDPFEWLPFIDAEARQGDAVWAADLSVELVRAEPKLQRGLCALWSRIAAAEPGPQREAGEQMRANLACGR